VIVSDNNSAVSIKLNGGKVKSLVRDLVKSAEAIDLIYISGRERGIKRVRNGEGFIYISGNKRLRDKETLERIKSLVIPPAWEDVWISPTPLGHVQAVGIDKNGRRQYRYHPLWSALRSQTKYLHLYEFGKALPEIRKRVNADLSLPGLPLQKVLAIVVSLLQNTGVRVGNSMYEKLYGSYGLSTLKNKHVKINGSELKFAFMGKKGIYQELSLRNRKLARLVKQCKEIRGKELFQYMDENGSRRSIDSGMVNDYIREISGKSFTSKDFRTWLGSVTAIEILKEFDSPESITGAKKIIIEALDIVASKLGNTRNVCRKYYVHPIVIDHFLDNTLNKYVKEPSSESEDSDLSQDEKALMKMLAEARRAEIVLSA
jgi:DNA topoisomerase I